MEINLKDIINGWKNVIIKDEDIETLHQQRMEICNACPKKIEQLGMAVCGECGCPLMAKTRSLDSKCPLDKW